MFRVAFVPGVTPDRWLRTWRERVRGVRIEATQVPVAAQRAVLYDGRADMCFVRLPVDREGLHVIPLYREVPVVVVPRDHVVTAFDEVSLADLADEHLLEGPWTTQEAIALVAAGEGVVVVPKSLARLHHRKDVDHRPVTDAEESQVGLAWRVDAADDRTETFIGIVRGRTARSSRG